MSKTPIDIALDKVDWVVVERDQSDIDNCLPYATHSGVLDFGQDVKLRCYRLNTGEAVFDARDIEKFFEGLSNE